MTLNVWQFDPVNITPYYNLALCEALASAGCKVRYITSQFLYDDNLPYSPHFQTDFLYFQGLEHPALVKLPRLRRALRLLDYPLGHRRLLRDLHRQPPDILHMQWSRLPRFDLPLIRNAQALRVPVVFTVHETVPVYESQRIQPKLEQVYAAADRLIVHTEANRTDLLSRCPSVDPTRVRVIPHIALEHQAVPPDATQHAARLALGLLPHVPTLVFFGGIRHYKGLDVLAAAYQIAFEQRPDLHLIVAGRPESPEDAAILNQLRHQPNTLIQEGFIPYEEVWKYHLAGDIAVLPYRHAYQSGALLTAMNFKRPVLVTNVGGLPETVDGNGWVVPPENPTALAEAILKAVSDMDQLRQMGERSRQLVDERYSGSAIARQTIDVYTALTGKSAQ
jgi:D-inositol-3-phosphate glycosyltransferase